jgi:hypothetical protein
MPKFTLFIEYQADTTSEQTSKWSQDVAARDVDEAICAAEAVADFAVSALEGSVQISILDQRQAQTVKVVRRPLDMQN